MNTDPTCGTLRSGWQVYEAPGVQPVFLNERTGNELRAKSRVLSLWHIRILGRHSVLWSRSKAMTRMVISRASAPDQLQFSRNAVHRAADPNRDAVSSCHSSKYLGFAASPLFAEWQDPSRHTRRR